MKKDTGTDFEKVLFSKMGAIPDGICCVCGHLLSSHVNENNEFHRCHALGQDLYQCECRLVRFFEDEKLEDFDLRKRMERHHKEFKEGHG